jgi:A/G-specific adenine glycosylase
MPKLKSKKSKKSISPLAFQRNILAWYSTHKRKLPWRQTRDPYKIMVSEFMLQQTQVIRVLPKYKAWMKQFPTVRDLALAPIAEVLSFWSGLGYNRRALALHRAAQIILSQHNGVVPKDTVSLEALPGIGRYTAQAIAAFAFNEPVVMIETNIRTVFLDAFFKGSHRSIEDKQLLALIAQCLPKTAQCSVRDWYWALMDYGTFLKSSGNRIHQKSKHYHKQSSFKGSTREVRGAILKHLLQHQRCTIQTIKQQFPHQATNVSSILTKLKQDGLIMVNKNIISLP